MEFFSRFKQLYNFSKSVESTIYITEGAWYDFQEKIKDYSLEMFEELYRVIVHYHYIETKKLDDYPYKLKSYNGDRNDVGNGIVFEPKNLPLCLQYILLNWY